MLLRTRRPLAGFELHTRMLKVHSRNNTHKSQLWKTVALRKTQFAESLKAGRTTEESVCSRHQSSWTQGQNNSSQSDGSWQAHPKQEWNGWGDLWLSKSNNQTSDWMWRGMIKNRTFYLNHNCSELLQVQHNQMMLETSWSTLLWTSRRFKQWHLTQESHPCQQGDLGSPGTGTTSKERKTRKT